MPLGLPESSTEVEDRIKIDVAREATDSDPYTRNHWLLALIVGFGRRVFDFYRTLKRAIDQLFPDTATDEYAERWGAIYGKSRIAATQSTGNMIATGSAGTTIPVSTAFNASSNTYTSTAEVTVAANSISVTSLTRSGTTATATTASDHGLASNVTVDISGAVETDYNVASSAIIVTGLDTFTFEVAGSPTTPATGTILADYTSAIVPVESDGFGDDQNLTADTAATIQSPISGLDNDLRVDYGAVEGGTDQESIASLRDRYLERIRNPVAHFNKNDIIEKAKEVAGVTRVFVDEAGDSLTGEISVSSITRSGDLATVTTGSAHGLSDGMDATIAGATQTDYNGTFSVIVDSTTVFYYIVAGTPTTPATGTITSEGKVALGTVDIYFTRDNDDSLVPSGSEVNTVAAKIAEIIPANTSSTDVNVAAPVVVSTDYVFSDLTPNTTGMRTAVTANLNQFFKESTSVGVDVDEDAYRAAIFNTVDETTGAVVSTFTLSAPSGDIAISSGEIGTLGNITFP